MSIETKHFRIPLEEAEELIEKARLLIAPFIKRFCIVGSVGRKEETAGDLDILVEPKGAYLDKRNLEIEEIRRRLSLVSNYKKGGDRQIIFNNFRGSRMSLDLSLCHPPAQWGVIKAVKINPIPIVIYGKQVIDSKGLIREGGTIFREDSLGRYELDLRHEEAWFHLVGLPFVLPEKRNAMVEELGIKDWIKNE